MSGREDMSGRHWSTRQRLVVLTFDTPQQARTFDLLGGPAITPEHDGIALQQLDAVRLVDLMEACRDVIDSFDDLAEHSRRMLSKTTHGQLIEHLRSTLFELRQAAMA